MTYQDASEGMDMGGSHTVSAFYDSRSHAEAAAQRLRGLGIAETQIRLTEGQSEGSSSGTEDQGFFAMLGEMFFPSDDRSAYAEGLNRGGSLLTVTDVSEAEYDDVLDILDDEGAVDMDERTANWREEGWSEAAFGAGRSGTGDELGGSTGLDDSSGRSREGLSVPGAIGAGGVASAGVGSDLTGASGMDRSSAGFGSGAGFESARTGGTERGLDETVEVVEERLRVGKRDASRGTVRVRSYVVEKPVSETVNLREDRVEIERRPVDRSATATENAFQDRSIEAEEYREEAVVSKEARVVEEIGLRRTSENHEETISDTLRHTEVEIEDDRDDTLPSGDVTRR